MFAWMVGWYDDPTQRDKFDIVTYIPLIELRIV
jgi:hypothetical protein